MNLPPLSANSFSSDREAALSTARLAAREFPTGLRRFIIVADNGPAGRSAASTLAQRAEVPGIEIERVVACAQLNQRN